MFDYQTTVCLFADILYGAPSLSLVLRDLLIKKPISNKIE